MPMPIFSLLFARHAKAFFLAVDHFYDPRRWDSMEQRRAEPVNTSIPSISRL